MAASKCVDFKLNRSLLDPNFGGYKLSLDPLPTYSLQLNADADVAKLPDDLYSYQHLKAFGVHNHLYLDPWNTNTVWFVDEAWRMQKVTVQDWKLSGPTEAFGLTDAANRRLIPKRVNASLSFASGVWLVVSDGTDRLYLINTGNRLQNEAWKVAYCDEPLGSDVYFVVLHSTWHSVGKMACIEVLCLHVDDAPKSTSKHASAFVTKLVWLTFHSDGGDVSMFELVRTRRLESGACPSYAAILPTGTGIVVMNEKNCRFAYDSVNPVPEAKPKNDDSDDGVNDVEKAQEETPKPDYTWMQESDSIIISFRLPDSTVKDDVSFELHSNSIRISLRDDDVKDPRVLLEGELHGTVSVDGSAWSISDAHILEVHIAKSTTPTTWPGLVIGDDRGKLILSTEQMEAVNDQLEKYTTDTANDDPEEGRKSAFNTEQLEDCDAYSDKSSAIWCLDGESHDVVQQVNVGGNQWLFSTVLSPDSAPVICLRHDVDGIVWQPTTTTFVTDGNDRLSSLSWQHVGTFNALGYVQASKQQRKFVTCAVPSMAYTAIADCVRHIYVYHRPAAIKSPVRNRRTGETIAAVARQQLVSIESMAEILGMCASDTHIYVLAGKTLYAMRLGQQE